jgi:hypothetical protein
MRYPITTTSVLEDMRDLLSDPRHWTQGTFARDMDLDSVSVGDSTACCWCMQGAQMHFLWQIAEPRHRTYLQESTNRLLHVATFNRGYVSIPLANDTSTHEQMLAILTDAIELSLAPPLYHTGS